MQAWLQGPITTRQEVLETVRAYHTGVIRTEIQQMVMQVERVVKGLNDRILRQHDHLRWLTTDSRMDQKKLCGVQVLLNGFDSKIGPEERLFMISWMFEPVEYFRSYLKLRDYNTVTRSPSQPTTCSSTSSSLSRPLLQVVVITPQSPSLLLNPGT